MRGNEIAGLLGGQLVAMFPIPMRGNELELAAVVVNEVDREFPIPMRGNESAPSRRVSHGIGGLEVSDPHEG